MGYCTTKSRLSHSCKVYLRTSVTPLSENLLMFPEGSLTAAVHSLEVAFFILHRIALSRYGASGRVTGDERVTAAYRLRKELASDWQHTHSSWGCGRHVSYV